MFQYLKGEVVEIYKDFFILEVGNVGYKIFAPSSTIQRLIMNKEIYKIYTYVQIREDSWTIYGFKTRVELKAFELLLTVSGVGPKVACGIISGCSPKKIAMLIASSDSRSLSKLPGIGPKTAQRIILELKDKAELLELSTSPNNQGDYNSQEDGGVNNSKENEKFDDEYFDNDYSKEPASGAPSNTADEAIEALISLGYTVNEAKTAVSACYKENCSIENLIKQSLSYSGRKH